MDGQTFPVIEATHIAGCRATEPGGGDYVADVEPETFGVDPDRSRYIALCLLSVAIGVTAGTAIWCSLAVSVALDSQAPLRSMLAALAAGVTAGAPLGAIAGLTGGLTILGWTRHDKPMLVGALALLVGQGVVLWIAFNLVNNNPVAQTWRLLPITGQLLLAITGTAIWAWAYQRRFTTTTSGETAG